MDIHWHLFVVGSLIMSTRKRCLGFEEPNCGDSNKKQATSGTSVDTSVPLKSCLKSNVPASRKPVRGKTTLQVTPTGEAGAQQVTWNERGQPVGKISERFSSTVGVIVREHAPLNAMTWHKVCGPTRDDLWDYLMVKFTFKHSLFLILFFASMDKDNDIFTLSLL